MNNILPTDGTALREPLMNKILELTTYVEKEVHYYLNKDDFVEIRHPAVRQIHNLRC
jgi:aspartyl-tRNA synthetase